MWLCAGQRHEVHDEREHVVEGVAQHDDAERSRDGADGSQEEDDRGHSGVEFYSPSARSGVRSSGSARSISFVKMRSSRE